MQKRGLSCTIENEVETYSWENSWEILTECNDGVVEEGAEEGGALGMEAAQLQSQEDGRDGREVPGWEEHDRRSIDLISCKLRLAQNCKLWFTSRQRHPRVTSQSASLPFLGFRHRLSSLRGCKAGPVKHLTFNWTPLKVFQGRVRPWEGFPGRKQGGRRRDHQDLW